MVNKHTKDLVGMIVSICEKNNKHLCFLHRHTWEDRLCLSADVWNAGDDKGEPEILFMDTTYGVNNLNMHLTTLMVEDGHCCHGGILGSQAGDRGLTDKVPPDLQGNQ